MGSNPSKVRCLHCSFERNCNFITLSALICYEINRYAFIVLHQLRTATCPMIITLIESDKEQFKYIYLNKRFATLLSLTRTFPALCNCTRSNLVITHVISACIREKIRVISINIITTPLILVIIHLTLCCSARFIILVVC